MKLTHLSDRKLALLLLRKLQLERTAATPQWRARAAKQIIAITNEQQRREWLGPR